MIPSKTVPLASLFDSSCPFRLLTSLSDVVSSLFLRFTSLAYKSRKNYATIKR